MPTLALLGDVMLGRGVGVEAQRRDPESFWGTVRPVLLGVDAVFSNLECAITRTGRPWSRTPKVFHFRAPPEAIAILKAGNVRGVSLANNHTLDFEVVGLRETIQHLDAAGIAHAGAGENLVEARAPALFDVAGLRLGVVSVTDNEPPFAASASQPGVHHVDLGNDPGALDLLREDAAAARRAGAAVVLLSLHWGPNMVTAPSPAFQRLARASLEFASVVHGHSAHVFQGIEARRGRLVLYDTGDFLDDYRVDRVLRNDWSFVFLVDFSAAGAVERLRLVPVRLHFARVELATGEEREEICDRMIARASGLGTTLERLADGLALAIGG